jgi:hypothetical protein
MMSRPQAAIVAVGVAMVALVAGWLLAGAAQPDLPEPIVVEGPSPVPPSSDSGILPPRTVGPTGPPPSADDDSTDEVSNGADDDSGGEDGG